jgi:segregation and condensation protein B
LKKGFREVEDSQWKAIIESLIFVSESPLSLDQIKEVLGGEVSKKEIQRLLFELQEDCEHARRGVTLVEVAEGFQFRTRPQHAEWIKKLKKTKPVALSRPALETLAIVAYKQPILRSDVEKIRGVDSGGVLRTLLERKLIRILGKKDVPGKPLVYGTSKQFLEMFGLKDLSSLPTLKDLEGLGVRPPEEVFPFSGKELNKREPAAAGESGILPGEEAEIDEPPAEGAEDSF